MEREQRGTTATQKGTFEQGGLVHLLARGLSDGIWYVDAEGKTVFFNDALPMMLGCTAETMRHSALADFLVPEDRDSVMGAIRAGAIVRGQHRQLIPRRSDGAGRWFRMEVVPTHDLPGGQGPGALIVLTETTALRHGEEARAYLSTLVATSEDAIFGSDIGNVITSWNRGAERIFGYTEHEAVGRDSGMLVPSEMITQEQILHERMANGELVEAMEFTGLRKNGSRVALALSVTPVFDAYDNVVGYSKVARDLSLKKQAEELRERHTAIVESSDDAIVSKGLDGNVQTWNRGAERVFGYTAEEMVGRSISILLPDDRQHEEEEILKKLRRGERIDHFLTVRKRKDGRLIDVFVTISPLRDGKGNVIGASKIARDVTELMASRMERDRRSEELEQLVEQRTAELRGVLKEMESFSYTVSHDLRAPLRTIAFASMMLKESLGDEVSEEQESQFRRQDEAVKRVTRLIDELMNYAQLSHKELVLQELHLENTAASVWRELTREGAPADLNFSVATGISAMGDLATIRFVFQNLLQNAIKFSPEGGTISVGQEADGTIFVRDEGIGFDMQYAGKLFEPFHRLVREADFPGTGIGLASVRRIVERHGGRVWAESEPGKGSTFRFTLPEPAPREGRAAA